MKITKGLYKGWSGQRKAPSSYLRHGNNQSWFAKRGYLWTGNRKTGVGGWFHP